MTVKYTSFYEVYVYFEFNCLIAGSPIARTISSDAAIPGNRFRQSDAYFGMQVDIFQNIVTSRDAADPVISSIPGKGDVS